jgi:hypothetical protein
LWHVSNRRKTKISNLFYQHQVGEILILDEIVDVTTKDKKIVEWTVIVEEQLKN